MKFRKTIKSVPDPSAIEPLAQTLKVEPLIARLLLQRGITTFDEARNFFRPELTHLHDPYRMRDMDKAVKRIEDAIEKGEKILVFGDYDVDGTTGVALFYSFLKKFYREVTGKKPDAAFYIPDRYSEGYGISVKGIDFAAENGFSLIIAIDCGIKAVDKISYACEKKIDFIVCDHHLPGEELPPAVAVLDPKQNGCEYPFKELSGCGVAFKLAQAIAIRHDKPLDCLTEYLDLVALSIAADIVPMVGENRVLAFSGLKIINESPRAGIKALKNVGGLRNQVNSGDLVFVLAPRINAAGRIDSGRKAVELLLCEDEERAGLAASAVNTDNTTRKDLDIQITRQAIEMIENDSRLLSSRSTVLFHPEWHKGVIGIVASRVIEKFYRPTILLTESNGVATGSARSIRNFDIYSAIEECSDLLEQFGGHRYAAGLTMKVENVEKFRNRFEEVVSGIVDDEMLIPVIEVDAEIGLSDINPRLVRILRQFGPFGPGNMNPVFLTRQVRDSGYAKVVGNNHLKLKLFESARPPYKFDAIAFGKGDALPTVSNSQPLTICYTIEEKEWMGRTEIQLRIKDLDGLE